MIRQSQRTQTVIMTPGTEGKRNLWTTLLMVLVNLREIMTKGNGDKQ